MKLSAKTWVIVGLVVFVVAFALLPLEVFVGKPSILGMVLAKVYIKPLEINKTCNAILNDEWNLIGIGCITGNDSLEYMLASIEGEYESIHTYDTLDADDKWKSYNPALPNWTINDLSIISPEKGYWINVNNSSSYSIEGTILIPRRISLTSGWNLVGYAGNVSNDENTAFATITGSYSIAWMYNSTSSNYLYYNPTLGSGTMNGVERGYGYWLNITNNVDWWIS